MRLSEVLRDKPDRVVTLPPTASAVEAVVTGVVSLGDLLKSRLSEMALENVGLQDPARARLAD